MARWERAHWESSLESGVPRRDRRSGDYDRYVPDTLDGLVLGIDGSLSRRVSSVERGIRRLNASGTAGVAGISRLLLRSEAIASSRIEGIAPSAQQVALAELGQSQDVRGVSAQARLVANNLTIVRRSTQELVATDRLLTRDITDLHAALLPDEDLHHGLRTVQNWIGSSDWTPIDADFVPPAHDRVVDLMEDLVDYMNGAAHAALVQAALVHAQFETIHPFTDGNGRVGRALVHAVLTRRGLTDQAVLPVSLVLATLRNQYVTGLTSYRHAAPAGSEEGNAAVNRWLSTFVEAADVALERSIALLEEVETLREEWNDRLTTYRLDQGLRAVPRANSASSRLLAQLTEAPVVTATTLARILHVSYPAANSALEELRGAGILSTKVIERGATAYLARDVLNLVTDAERAVASTQFDTGSAPPNRQVPARPH